MINFVVQKFVQKYNQDVPMFTFKSFFSYLVPIALFLSVSSCDILNQVMKQVNVPLTQEEAVKGLKSALKVGTDTAVKQLTKTNGFYADALVKLSLPPEAQVIIKNVSKIPLVGNALVTETEKLINKAAEDAAKKAGPIFTNAITSMSISDALNLVKGSDSSATAYLRSKTYSQLFNSFKPVVEQSLKKNLIAGISAESSYKSLVDKYNKVASIPLSGLTPVTNNSLTNYTTNKALQGLFKKVAAEEKDIRNDPMARVNDVLKKVFGNQSSSTQLPSF